MTSIIHKDGTMMDFHRLHEASGLEEVGVWIHPELRLSGADYQWRDSSRAEESIGKSISGVTDEKHNGRKGRKARNH